MLNIDFVLMHCDLLWIPMFGLMLDASAALQLSFFSLLRKSAHLIVVWCEYSCPASRVIQVTRGPCRFIMARRYSRFILVCCALPKLA